MAQFRFGKTAQFFSEIGAVLKLFQYVRIGPNGRPTLRMAPLTWACPVSVQTGPVTWAQGLSVGANHWASTGEWAHGPNEIRPEHWLLEAPMDRMRSYP